MRTDRRARWRNPHDASLHSVLVVPISVSVEAGCQSTQRTTCRITIESANCAQCHDLRNRRPEQRSQSVMHLGQQIAGRMQRPDLVAIPEQFVLTSRTADSKLAPWTCNVPLRAHLSIFPSEHRVVVCHEFFRLTL